MMNMFIISVRQLMSREILWLLAKTFLVTVILVALLGVPAYFGAQYLVEKIFESYENYATALAVAMFPVLFAITIAILLFRIVAMLVINIFSDDVVDAVEARHYPDAAESAKPPSYILGLKMGFRSALRALGYNLAAVPIYILLLVTGVGTAAAFFVVNGLLIGRDYQDMVASRHVPDPRNPPSAWQVSPLRRFVLGFIIAVLLAIPFVNFLAPVLGAAMATHLVHQKRMKDVTT